MSDPIGYDFGGSDFANEVTMTDSNSGTVCRHCGDEIEMLSEYGINFWRHTKTHAQVCDRPRTTAEPASAEQPRLTEWDFDYPKDNRFENWPIPPVAASLAEKAPEIITHTTGQLPINHISPDKPQLITTGQNSASPTEGPRLHCGCLENQPHMTSCPSIVGSHPAQPSPDAQEYRCPICRAHMYTLPATLHCPVCEKASPDAAKGVTPMTLISEGENYGNRRIQVTTGIPSQAADQHSGHATHGWNEMPTVSAQGSYEESSSVSRLADSESVCLLQVREVELISAPDAAKVEEIAEEIIKTLLACKYDRDTWLSEIAAILRPYFPQVSAHQHNFDANGICVIGGCGAGLAGEATQGPREPCDDCTWHSCTGKAGGCGCKCHFAAPAAPEGAAPPECILCNYPSTQPLKWHEGKLVHHNAGTGVSKPCHRAVAEVAELRAADVKRAQDITRLTIERDGHEAQLRTAREALQEIHVLSSACIRLGHAKECGNMAGINRLAALSSPQSSGKGEDGKC